MHTFNTPGPIDLRVELWQGEVSVVADDTDTTTVELTPLRNDAAARDAVENARVEQRGNEVVVLMPKAKGGLFRGRAEVRADIHVPAGSNASIETASADIETNGQLGNLRAASGSGDVSIDVSANLEVRTGSGDIRVTTVHGSCTIKCGSADVRVDTVTGSFRAKTGSGDIMLVQAGHTVDAMAGSGDMLLKRIEQGNVKVKTGTGDVQIGVADGTAAYLDIMTVTGDVTSDLDAAEAPSAGERMVDINVQSGSGDVVLQRS